MYRNSILGTLFLKVTHLLELAHTVCYEAHECGEELAAQLSQTWGWQGHQGSLSGWQPPSAVSSRKPLGSGFFLTVEWRPTAWGCVGSEDRALYPQAPALTRSPWERPEVPVIFLDSHGNRRPICFFALCT